MKKSIFLLINSCFIALLLAGCCRSADDIWDDTRTAGRHMGRGLRSLGGKHGDSRQVCCREDFLHSRDEEYRIEDFQAMEFEPLPDQAYSPDLAALEHKNAFVHEIPGIEAFKDPKEDPNLAALFQNVRFPYNSSLIKGQENREIIRAIAAYLKKRPNVYLFIEGHCDERGAEAYNLALGSRRSNSVKDLLVKEGVSPEAVYTVSYGKERPLDMGHTEEAWAKNRRAEFKIYNL